MNNNNNEISSYEDNQLSNFYPTYQKRDQIYSNSGNSYENFNTIFNNDNNNEYISDLEMRTILEDSNDNISSNINEEDSSRYFNKYTNQTKESRNINENKFQKIIFSIEIKKKVKRGRKNNNNKNRKGNGHKRDEKDNIITKIYRKYLSNIYHKLNKKIKGNAKLKKINISEFIKDIYNKKYNAMISKTVREIFSAELSKRFKKENKFHNLNIINKIYEDKKANEELVEILNLKMCDMYHIYIGKSKEEKYSEFYGLEEDIETICRDEDENYKIKYKNIALKLLEIIQTNGKKT
jgi:hypothetical protein